MLALAVGSLRTWVLNALVACRVSDHLSYSARARCAPADGGVSSSPEPQGVGMRRVGYVSGVHGACSKQTAVSSRRAEVRLSSPEGVDISVSSSRYSFHDGSTPASGTLCLSHGGRKSRRSVDVASASLRCAARRSVPPIASWLAGGRGLYLHWLLGVGKQRRIRVRAAV